jgi:type II secretory pathway pseudopilin PulG
MTILPWGDILLAAGTTWAGTLEVRREMERRRGSALTTLLLAAGLVAVLGAAVAPSLLESRVRSGVARTRADMAEVARALEAYNLDHFAYPPDVNQPGRDAYTFLGRLRRLTSPVAYLARLPDDHWALREAFSGTSHSAPYHRDGDPTKEVLVPIVYDYAKFDPGLDSPAIWAEITQRPDLIHWAISSPGPDEIVTYLGFSGYEVYDPTNGTISWGDILHTSVSPHDMPSR